MAYFTRSNLQYNYYWTTTQGDSKLTGEPDHSLLSRTEGYEVLYMINKIMSIRSLSSVSEGQKIERMIHQAPSNYHSQAHIKTWIDNNWNRY